MRDYLLDLVEHTFDLGCIELLKITGDDKETAIVGMADDRSKDIVEDVSYAGRELSYQTKSLGSGYSRFQLAHSFLGPNKVGLIIHSS